MVGNVAKAAGAMVPLLGSALKGPQQQQASPTSPNPMDLVQLPDQGSCEKDEKHPNLIGRESLAPPVVVHHLA